MPAKRLPWFRFWIDATSHGKVRRLNDATFRTWVELLDAAAKQPRRGRFEDEREAVSVVRRPLQHVKALIAAKLIDETAEGLVMHDWDEWQRWRQEDGIDDGSSPDRPPNGHANNSRMTHEQLANDPVLRVGAEGDTDTERDTPSGDKPKLRVVRESIPKPTPRPTPVGTLIDKIRALDPHLEIYGDQGFTGTKLKQNPEVDLGLIAEAYVAFRHGEWPGSKMLRETNALAWTIGDVGGYVAWRAQRRGATRLPPDRTGVAN